MYFITSLSCVHCHTISITAVSPMYTYISSMTTQEKCITHTNMQSIYGDLVRMKKMKSNYAINTLSCF